MLQSQHCNVSSLQFFRLVGSLYFPPGSCLSNNKIKPPCCVSDSPRVVCLFVYMVSLSQSGSSAILKQFQMGNNCGANSHTSRKSLTSLSFTHTQAHASVWVQRNSKTLLQTSGNLLLANRAEDKGQLLSPCQDESRLSLIHKSWDPEESLRERETEIERERQTERKRGRTQRIFCLSNSPTLFWVS